ncbi:MAG: VOC family protein [Ilumatobacteraceae bacterium]
MELAKPFLDLGMYCADIDASRAFYEGELGLEYDHLLKVGGGLHQHRLRLVGAVLKLNSSRTPLPTDAPTCLRSFSLPATTGAPGQQGERFDPDGTRVEVTPSTTNRPDLIGIEWASRDTDRLTTMLRAGLGAVGSGDDRWTVGSTEIRLIHDAAAEHAPEGTGFRYLTVQVFDVRGEHERLCEEGWSEVRPPVRLGDTAAISFVRDPDGVLLEVSQRASLTGALPDL